MALLLWAAGAHSGPRAALGAKLSPVCPLRHHQPAPALGVMAKSLRTGVGSILGLTRGEGGFLKLELELVGVCACDVGQARRQAWLRWAGGRRRFSKARSGGIVG